MRRTRLPHSRPSVGRAEIAALARVVRSRQLAQGAEVARLEREMAARLGFRHAVAVQSGTAALHLALLGLGAGRGDRVLAPSYVCTAVLNAIRYVGGREVLVDSDPADLQMDRGQALTAAGRARLAIVPHLFGDVADCRGLVERGVDVIEDCAMAIGAGRGRRGPGHLGRVATYSFYATKPLCAGEGGLLCTDDDTIAAEARDRRDYDKKPVWRLRFNYKLTDLQAALVRVQLARLDRLVERRRRLAGRYFELLDPDRLVLPPRARGATYHRFVVRVAAGFEAAARHFAGHGIDVARPVDLPLHRASGRRAAAFPVAERLWLTAVSLPIYPDLTMRQVGHVAAVANRLAPR